MSLGRWLRSGLVCFHKLSKHKDRTEGIRERVEEKQQEGKGKEKLEEER